MRIAITGASGFIGKELTACAHDAGHQVNPVSRARSGIASYEDEAALAKAFDGCDVVVHLAARAHVGGNDADFECNVRATRAVTRATRTSGAKRLVFLSSIGVNGNVTRGRPFTEEDAPSPVEPYARSKQRAEEEVRSSGIESVILRPPLVYGANAPGNFTQLVRVVARGWPLPLSAVRNKRSVVGVRNLSELILLCASHPGAANETFVVADGDDLSTPEIIRAIAEGQRKRARLWDVPVPLLKAGAALAGRTRIAESLCESLQVDASKARRVLGWAPSSTSREGIARTAAEWSGQ
jgi:nucleoside-diphosphate-sugar epimerase